MKTRFSAAARDSWIAFLALGPRPQDGRKQESAAAASQESIRLLVSFKRTVRAYVFLSLMNALTQVLFLKKELRADCDGFLMKRNVCFHLDPPAFSSSLWCCLQAIRSSRPSSKREEMLGCGSSCKEKKPPSLYFLETNSHTW